ncbi:hypothetical protein YE105_P0005 (plasmid) [Yersinia enterocolitica subsp. palearctica 105.5R(r)]|uniref:Uncharacterized protein n=1 Tax=Yersinia enterocolitica subsp. palearctica serotype O:3 (strain DSM 13030 / CIP 106945 / Y11) TaxID=930944 RepID=A0A0H3NY82_YERE1|nr:hypothetical protein YE105_P0005 [Yersinia enterocolitica subsp. palearctica 105.5R(r)]CBY78192.1 hypothetical protein Y11_p0951 [Yersinia enterocolitica subsp. palearctica Y11]
MDSANTYTNNKADSTLKDANNYTTQKVNRDAISGVIDQELH